MGWLLPPAPMPSFSLGSQAPCLGVGCQAYLSAHLLYLSPSVLQGSGETGTDTDTEGFSSLMVNSSQPIGAVIC